ncbi:Osmotin thaumatin-like protein [Suillus decipiens]|nr:Osmotin thaumatin-like protein [Suillus decipiens]
MATISALVLAAIVTVAQAQSLNVVNSCSESVFLYTQTSFGSIDNNVTITAGQSSNLGISSNWDGAINVGTGCNNNGSTCTTGGPIWDGSTPFSRAEFNFYAIPGSVTYDISVVYGYNVGMQIYSANASCDAFACTISSGCPVPGPGNDTCYSPCCSSASACSDGAVAVGGGSCLDNEGPGPNSPFYYDTCYNAYAFSDNNDGVIPVDFVTYTCGNTNITLTLCPDVGPSHYTS